MYPGELVSARWARDAGLVSEVIEASVLLDRTMTLAQSVARHSVTHWRCGRAHGLRDDHEAGLEAESHGVATLWGTVAQKAACPR